MMIWTLNFDSGLVGLGFWVRASSALTCGDADMCGFLPWGGLTRNRPEAALVWSGEMPLWTAGEKAVRCLRVDRPRNTDGTEQPRGGPRASRSWPIFQHRPHRGRNPVQPMDSRQGTSPHPAALARRTIPRPSRPTPTASCGWASDLGCWVTACWRSATGRAQAPHAVTGIPTSECVPQPEHHHADVDGTVKRR